MPIQLTSDNALLLWHRCIQKRGWLYIATNHKHADVFKIGLTQKDPFKRAKTLTTAGVSGAYSPLFAQMYVDCFAAEAKVHSALSEYNIEKELFNIPQDKAVQVMSDIFISDSNAVLPYKIDYLLYDKTPDRWMAQFNE